MKRSAPPINKRRRRRQFFWPALANSLAHRLNLEAVLLCHLGNPSAIVKPARGLVLRLFVARYPAAVLRRVRPIDIHSFNGQRRRIPGPARPMSKCLVRVAPCVADFDATPAVVRPPNSIRVKATGLHPCPNPEQAAAGFAVRPLPRTSGVIAQASARPGFAFAEPVPRDARVGATFAKAQPCNVRLETTVSLYNSQAPEGLPAEVNHGASSHLMMVPKHFDGWA